MTFRRTAIVVATLALALTACSNSDKESTAKTVLTGKQPNGTTYTLTLDRGSVKNYSSDLTVTDRVGKKSVTLGEAVKQCHIPFTKGAKVYKFMLSATSKATNPSIYVDLGTHFASPKQDKNLHSVVFLNSVTENCTDGVLLRKSGSLPMKEGGYIIMMSGSYEGAGLSLTAKESSTTSTFDTLAKVQGATVDEPNVASMPFLP